MNEVNKPNGSGIKRIYRATQCSIKGLVAAFKYESAFRQELVLCCILLPLAAITSQHIWQFVALTASLIFLLIVELLNSAIEATVDRIGPEHHTLAGRAKDIGSAAVTLALILLTLVWGAHFYAFVTS